MLSHASVVSLVVLAAAAPSDAPAGTAVLLYPDAEAVRALRPDSAVIVHGKYLGLVESQLELWEVPLTFRVKDDQLRRRLLEFRPKVDNIAVSGTVLGPRAEGDVRGDRVIEVSGVTAAPPDAELFRDALKALVARRDRTSEELFGLALTLHRLREINDDETLSALLARAVVEGYNLARASIDPNDPDGHLALIAEVHGRIPDRRTHAELLKLEERRFPGHAGFAAMLAKLGFKSVNGEWIEYDEFKRREGFVKYRNVWVKTADAEFFEILESLTETNRTNLILRANTDRAYEQIAKSGMVERGMNRNEVSTALGFADRVRRRRLADLEVDQWDYGDQRIYFLNGLVYEILDVDDDLPR